MKKLMVLLVVVIVALVSVGVVGAQEPGGQPGEQGGFGRGGRGDGPGLNGDILRLVVEETGLTPQEILDLAQEGQSLAQIITDNGGSVENVKNALTTQIDELLNTPLPQLRQEQMAERLLRGAVVDAAAVALDMTPRDVHQDMTEGQTLSDFITANGGDVAAVSADALTRAQEFLAERVENGNLTQEEADTLLASAETMISEILSQPMPQRPVRDGQGGRFGN